MTETAPSNRHLRILVLSNLFPPETLGGYELLAADVVEGLRQRGHEVEVLTTGTAPAEPEPGVHRRLALVRPFGERASLDRVGHLSAARRQISVAHRFLVERGPFDVVLVMSLRRLGLHVPRALTRLGVPMVFCFNDDWLLAHRPGEGATRFRRLVWKTVERGLLGARTWQGVDFERSIFVSGAIREALLAGGAPVPQGVVAWQGVSRTIFAARPPRAIPAAPRLMFAGRIHPTKGCDIAIETLHHLQHVGVVATLTVAGTGDAQELQRLRALAAELGVAERVTWAGFVSRDALAQLYRDHDVFLFPSRWSEPAGLTYLEAMACGVPVVAMPTGGARELLVHEVNCLATDGAEGMAQSVRRLLQEPELAATLTGGGERLLCDHASLDHYIDVIARELGAASTRVAA